MGKTAAEYARDYRTRHPERVAASKRACRERHREQVAAYGKAYRQANREVQVARLKTWRAANRLRVLAYSREYESANKDARREKDRRYNRTAARGESSRKWRERNPEAYRIIVRVSRAKRRARELHAPGHLTRAAVTARVAFYGWRCWMCGAPWKELDHVISLARGGANWPANVRPACRPCNRKKGARTVPVVLAT